VETNNSSVKNRVGEVTPPRYSHGGHMTYINIAGKKRKVVATVGAVRAILKKYDTTNIEDWDSDKSLDFAVDIMWKFLASRWFGLKLYLWRGRFARKLDVVEMRNAQAILMNLLYGLDDDGEDKESENSEESQAV